MADGWGFAKKLSTDSSGPVGLRREIVYQEVGLGAIMRQAYRRGKKVSRKVFQRA